MSKLNLELMRLIDQQYLEKPYYSVYRMWQWLVRDKGYSIQRFPEVRCLYDRES